MCRPAAAAHPTSITALHTTSNINPPPTHTSNSIKKQNLVALTFNQEAREADLRFGLVRVREAAEPVAFYGAERRELSALTARLGAAVENYGAVLVAGRNLDLFSSFYRYLIQLLPAAVVAPLYFRGEVDFGVVTQSSSAFSHVLGSLSLVVYQIQGLAGFSAVVDRLGQFVEATDAAAAEAAAAEAASSAASAAALRAGAAEEEVAAAASSGADGAGDGSSGSGGIVFVHLPPPPAGSAAPLLELQGLSVAAPGGRPRLVRGLDLSLREGESLLVVGASGAGKTSLLRALAGLWRSGGGRVVARGLPGLGAAARSARRRRQGQQQQEQEHAGSSNGAGAASSGSGGGHAAAAGARPAALFLPQRPYMVLGSLRDQLLYATPWGLSGDDNGDDADAEAGSKSSSGGSGAGERAGAAAAAAGPPPTDEELEALLRRVRLGDVLERCREATAAASGSGDGSGSGSGSGDGRGGRGSSSSGSGSGTGRGGGSGTGRGRGSSSSGGALDYACDFGSVLSLGEQQRLAFARLLLARPRLALLDEATSACDPATEAELYAAARAAGAALVSVGHRPSLARWHSRVLRLGAPGGGGGGDNNGSGGGGGWRLMTAEEYLEEVEAAARAAPLSSLPSPSPSPSSSQ